MDDSSPPPFDDLPELTRSLRSFGSRRPSGKGAAERDEQARFFAPLLEARRRAAAAPTRAQIAASFDARQLLSELDATLRDFASERFAARPPARRAFEAELFEIAEPLRLSLHRLREHASQLANEHVGAGDDWWAGWLAQLRATFRIADDSWPPMRDALDAAPLAVAKPVRRWRRSGPSGGGAP